MRNNRVLRFDCASSKADGADADGVLGQTDFVSGSPATTAAGLKIAYSCEVDTRGVLWIADLSNNRVVGHSAAASKANGASADFVFGQEDFVTRTVGSVSAGSLWAPSAIAVDPSGARLLIADSKRNRILSYSLSIEELAFSSVAATSIGSHTAVLSASISANAPLDAAGFVWSTSATSPTLSDEVESISGHVSGSSFSLFAKRFPAGSTVYYAAYATSPLGTSYSTASNFTTGSAITYQLEDSATFVVGQPDFLGQAAGSGGNNLSAPSGTAIDPANGKLYVSDAANNRVLRYAYPVVGNAPMAEAVFGQANTTGTSATLTATGLASPQGLYVDNTGRLWVADQSNNRVVWYANAHTATSGATADGVLGQDGFTEKKTWDKTKYLNKPTGVTVDNEGRLWVADTYNNRVVAYADAAKRLAGDVPDQVMGQADYTSSTPGTSSTTMDKPSALDTDTEGNLWVADRSNHRVLRFDAASSKADGAAADGVLGQADANSNTPALDASTMNSPEAVSADPMGGIWVAESGNRRVLGYEDAASKADGAAADHQLGNPSFTSAGSAPRANRIKTAAGVAVDPITFTLVAVDKGNNRAMTFDLSDPSGSAREEVIREELEEEATLETPRVWPNPSTGIFTLEIPSLEGTASVSVHDGSGRVILAREVGSRSSLDLSTMPKGMYFLSIVQGTQTTYTKLVVR